MSTVKPHGGRPIYLWCVVDANGLILPDSVRETAYHTAASINAHLPPPYSVGEPPEHHKHFDLGYRVARVTYTQEPAK